MLHVLSYINNSDKESMLIDLIHNSKGDIDFCFVSNQKDKWISRNIGFRQNGKVPEIWDPVSGEIIPVSIFKQEKDCIELPVTLPPFGSLFVVLKKDRSQPIYTEITGPGQYPPLFEYTKDGICLLQNGNVTLKKQDQSVTIQNENQISNLEGPWEVSFTKGWGVPEKVIFPKLISWTDSEIDGIKYYSGTAKYKKVFQYEPESMKGLKIYLDLGEISKVAEVWLNGQRLGITWTKPHRFDVATILRAGENLLTLEVSNTWSNRLTGEKYTNTNIISTIIPASTIETGDQTRYPWVKFPLIESGLLGPVSLVTIKPIQ